MPMQIPDLTSLKSARTGRRVAVCAAAAVISMIMASVAPQPATTHAAVNLNVHVHDDFFHPAGAFIVGSSTDHSLAAAACEVPSPASTCDAVIYVGDTITWVSPAPLATHLHTVTECTDGSFTVCGAGVAAANPIDDSGSRNPPSPGPSGWPYGPLTFNTAGTYYYRCEVHPSVMRGRVVVLTIPPPQVVGGRGEFADAATLPAGRTSGGGDALSPSIIAAIAAGIAALIALGVVALWARDRRT